MSAIIDFLSMISIPSLIGNGVAIYNIYSNKKIELEKFKKNLLDGFTSLANLKNPSESDFTVKRQHILYMIDNEILQKTKNSKYRIRLSDKIYELENAVRKNDHSNMQSILNDVRSIIHSIK